MTIEIEQLVKKIEEANEAYRTGTAIVTDEVYDSWVDELTEIDPENPVLSKIGYISDNDERKQRLPIEMASMNKVKTMESLLKWIHSKEITGDSAFILTPKYDGCSFCTEEKSGKGFTRGDGIHGQRSDEHLREINTDLLNESVYTYGEVIMPREIFLNNYNEDFKNPRNYVSGLLNADDARPGLNDCNYIRYGMVGDNLESRFNTKADLLDYLNSKQSVKVPYKVVTVKDLSDDYFRDLFIEWNKEYEIDGIIIEINDLKYAKSFGRERSGNPVWARAFKGEFEERKTSPVVALEWKISKKGHAVPRIKIEPIELDGVTVTYITGNNAKYIMEMGIGVGAEVLVKRSGMVIPYIIETTKRVDFEMPEVGYDLEWDKTRTHLITTEETPEQRLQNIISFFKILGVDNVSEGVCTQFFEAGYDSVKSILSMSKSDMESLERFGSRKAEIVHDAIHSKMKDVTLSKLQHASGFFEMLGSKKLLLLEHLENPSVNDITSLEGFSDKSAKYYLDAMPKFKDFVEGLSGLVTIKKTEKKEASSDEMADLTFVFTGVRRPDLVEIIEDRGGRVANGVSKKITHLVMKEKGSGSSKEKKAISLGKEILTVDELEKMLGV